MPRARNIKPSLFKNEILGEADPLLSLLFIGLWTLADREGRLEDRPKRIKAELFPYRELDVNGYLTELERLEFICRYSAKNSQFIHIKKFSDHQHPHKTEKASVIPEPPNINNKNNEMSSNDSLTEEEPLSNGSCPADSSNTDSSNTDIGETSSPTQMDVDELIWKTGIELFGGAEQSTRALLGKLAKDYGKQALADAIENTLVEKPVDPKSYVIGILKDEKNQPTRSTKNLSAAERTTRASADWLRQQTGS